MISSILAVIGLSAFAVCVILLTRISDFNNKEVIKFEYLNKYELPILFFLGGCLAAIFYYVSYGATGWFREDLRILLAMFFAVVPLRLIYYVAIARSAIRKLQIRDRVLLEVCHVIYGERNVYDDALHRFNEFANQDADALKAEAYRDVVEVLNRLRSRDLKLEKIVLNLRKSEESKSIAEVKKEAKLEIDRRRRIESDLNQKIRELERRLKSKEVMDLIYLNPSCEESALNDGFFAISDEVVEDQRKTFNSISRAIVENEGSVVLQEVLNWAKGVDILNGFEYTVNRSAHLTERDGYYRISVKSKDFQGEFYEGLHFKNNAHGFAGAMYAVWVLPGLLAWGHGRYDKDLELVLSKQDLWNVVVRELGGFDVEKLNTRVVPGIRWMECGEGIFRVSALAHRPGVGLLEARVNLKNGFVDSAHVLDVIRTGSGVFY